MYTHFESEVKAHPGTVPVVAFACWQTGSMEATQASIATVWQSEADRLMRQAYRLLHKTDADVEGIVSDALVIALERWQDITGPDHCRKALATTVRLLAMNYLRTSKATIEADETLPAPANGPSKATDATVAWLLDMCADDTERRILAIWMVPGNETAHATAAETVKWRQPWTPLEVNQLMRRLRAKAGVKLASDRSMRFQTLGTMPGLHCERFKTLGAVTLLTSGGRLETSDERMAGRHRVPMLSWDAVKGWVSGMEEVWSCV